MLQQSPKPGGGDLMSLQYGGVIQNRWYLKSKEPSADPPLSPAVQHWIETDNYITNRN